jgi:hypothetical protein
MLYIVVYKLPYLLLELQMLQGFPSDVNQVRIQLRLHSCQANQSCSETHFMRNLN